jgi:hypothetical protein
MREGEKMRMYVYIVATDKCFAPNPHWGYCTLATCNPRIRNIAQKGDWIIGLSPKAKGNKLVYAMKVNEKLTHDQYFKDPRFAAKKPIPDSSDPRKRCGDNIYFRKNDSAPYRQLPNEFHDSEDIKRDTSSEYVLISGKNDFRYYGIDAPDVPAKILQKIVVKRGHRSKFDQGTIDEVVKFIKSKPPTIPEGK